MEQGDSTAVAHIDLLVDLLQSMLRCGSLVVGILCASGKGHDLLQSMLRCGLAALLSGGWGREGKGDLPQSMLRCGPLCDDGHPLRRLATASSNRAPQLWRTCVSAPSPVLHAPLCHAHAHSIARTHTHPHTRRYEPGERISAEAALQHPFFKLQLPSSIPPPLPSPQLHLHGHAQPHAAYAAAPPPAAGHHTQQQQQGVFGGLLMPGAAPTAAAASSHTPQQPGSGHSGSGSAHSGFSHFGW